MTLLLEQILNGLQLGVTLFLMAAGLTLIFGIMGIINLAHGSLYMIGAYAGTAAAAATGSFWLAIPFALAAAALAGITIEALVIRRLYRRDHLDQVLATFALILIANQSVTILFGRAPLFIALPAGLESPVELLPGLIYPSYRLAIIAAGLATALGLWWLIARTRLGMLIRAGATDRDMVRALGVDIRLLYTLVFGLGALLAGLAGRDGRAHPLGPGRHGRADPHHRFRGRGRGRPRLDPRRLLRQPPDRPDRHAPARVPPRPSART